VTARRGPELSLDLLAAELDRMLAVADAELASRYPGESPGRQPVQVAYIPGHRFDANSVRQWGTEALAALAELAPDADSFAAAMGLEPGVGEEVRPLVLAKLATEPVEDVRVDFEDGYGVRGEETEDAHARAAARALAKPSAPAAPFCGLRCKSLERATRRRAIRTLDAFLGAVAEDGRPPPGFVITLPKVTSPDQVRAMTFLCSRLEAAHGLGAGTLRFEIQVEAPQLVLGSDGAATVARCVHAGTSVGRLAGLHYGTYDYSASLGIAARYQSPEHPAADHAKSVMQVAAAGTGVPVSDGSVNVLPVGSPDEVLAAWRLHARLVRRSLERGFYQGWDLHPRQLASRYAATFGFFRDGLASACDRLADYAQRASSGQEEPATAKALASYICRALDCCATTEPEVNRLSSLTRAELQDIRRHGRVP
jgi:citrate lyase beta subunit